jgi:hypothetical protein
LQYSPLFQALLAMDIARGYRCHAPFKPGLKVWRSFLSARSR